jgi:hypothetical protein
MSHGTFWLVLDVQRGSRSAPGSCHDVTGQDMINLNLPDAFSCWLSKRRTLKAQVDCKTLLASGVQAGTDCRPSSGCAALSDSKSARLGSGAARQQFTDILYHDLFGC